jgi:O-antigen/teichoic acid export membrane protein
VTRRPYGVSRLRRALIHFTSGRIAQAFARATLLLVLVRLLDVADYGAYMLLVGFSEMLLEVASFGILPVAQRYLPLMVTALPAARLSRFVSTIGFLQVGILCLITAGLWQAWPLITRWMGFSTEQIAAAKPALWLFLLVPAFRFVADLLEALLEQGKAQISRALMPTGRLVCIGLLLSMGTGIDLGRLILIDVAVTACCLLLSWFLLRQSLRTLHAADADEAPPVAEMVRFAWQMAPVGLMGAMASPGAIRLAVASALGIGEAGLFAFLQSLQRLVGRYLPGTLLRGIVRPVLVSRAFQSGGMAVVESGAQLLLKTNLLIVAAGSVGIAVGGDALVAWASGGKFHDAGSILLLMFLTLGFTSQRSVIEMVMQITGHTSTLTATAVLAPIALFAVWLYADLGLEVAITIIALAAALSNWLSMSVLRRATGSFKTDWRGVMATVAPAGLTVGVGVLLRTIVHPVLTAVIALGLFSVMLFLFKPFSKRELAIIERVAGPRAANLMRGVSFPR